MAIVKSYDLFAVVENIDSNAKYMMQYDIVITLKIIVRVASSYHR